MKQNLLTLGLCAAVHGMIFMPNTLEQSVKIKEIFV